MIPEEILHTISSFLDDDILKQEKVFGGDINNAAKIESRSGTVFFLKWNLNAETTLFEKEAEGLKELEKANSGFNIPAVIQQEKHFLLLEWIYEGGSKPNASFQAGRSLGKLHQFHNDQFGFSSNNYIGRLEQSNSLHSTWPDFYLQERIEFQLKMAIDAQKMPSSLLHKSDLLHQQIEKLFPAEAPSLLHGDLWSGNFMFTQDGGHSIYDPAVYYGHREMDLAMTRLFGGFSADFYRGYESVYPIAPGFDDRVNLCNLYPLLVHANLFGGSYVRQAEHILLSYT